MSGFRGSDEALDGEIETFERIARLRVRRYATDLRDLDRELRDLKAERAKRRAQLSVPAEQLSSESADVAD